MTKTIERLTNDKTGDWAEVCFDPNGGYAPGLGPVGVYYVRTCAAAAPAEFAIDHAAFSPSISLPRRAARQWIKRG